MAIVRSDKSMKSFFSFEKISISYKSIDSLYADETNCCSFLYLFDVKMNCLPLL
jgi:hypothetical protein